MNHEKLSVVDKGKNNQWPRAGQYEAYFCGYERHEWPRYGHETYKVCFQIISEGFLGKTAFGYIGFPLTNRNIAFRFLLALTGKRFERWEKISLREFLGRPVGLIFGAVSRRNSLGYRGSYYVIKDYFPTNQSLRRQP